MKKIIIIVSAILLVLMVIGIWYYLFVFGAPQSTNNIFPNFGGNKEDSTFKNEEGDGVATIATTTGNTAPDTLRQLSTKPVAGMTFIDVNTVRYAEQGTGYIFDIDLKNGREVQVSNTTFIKARQAAFSSNGTYVAITHSDKGVERTTVGEIDKQTVALKGSTNLISGADEVGFGTSESSLKYLLETNSGTEAYNYNLNSKAITPTFTLPFKGARALWNDTTYVYTRPASTLLGYVYRITNGVPTYVTNGGFGLMATYWDRGVIVSTRNNEGTITSKSVAANGDTTDIPLEIFPEKCAVPDISLGDILCAGALTLDYSHTYPDDWYKGIVSHEDLIWSIRIGTGEAVLIADPVSITGRPLDVTQMQKNNTGDEFLFINKNDNTLWLFSPKI